MSRERKYRAFTLVEVLLALMIIAMLLGSLGIATHAALSSYDVNEKVSSITQMTRSVLTRMNREVRSCDDLDSTTGQLTITPPDDGSGLTRILYEVQTGTLYCRRTVSGVETSYPLIGPASGVTVNGFYIIREDNLEGNPLSVTVRLDMGVGNRSFAVTSSATLRKNQLI